MPELSDYARRWDARRSRVTTWSGVISIILLAALGFSIAARLPGIIVVSAILLVETGCLSVSGLIPVHPSRLVVPDGRPIGRWGAQIGVQEFPRMVDRHRSLRNSMAMVDGHVEFLEDGTILWRPLGQYARRYPGSDLRWGPPYRLSARRLRGLGHHVHVAIRVGPDPDGGVTDVWLRGARRFPI